MALSIKNTKAERLAHEVAKETGENITQAVIHALEECLRRLRGRKSTPDCVAMVLEISARCSALPDLDRRSEEQILGYDDSGTFG